MIREFYEVACDQPRCRNIIDWLDDPSEDAILAEGWTVKHRCDGSEHYCRDHATPELRGGKSNAQE